MARRRILPIFFACTILGGGAAGAWFIKPFVTYAASMAELVRENGELRSALANLGHSDAIGHAKVLEQRRTDDGTTVTTIKFVAVDRDDPTRTELEIIDEVRGDEVYFDLLIVNFDDELVADGSERSLYLWRRIFGSAEAPDDGIVIETPGSHPERYAEISEALNFRDRAFFWSQLWDLADKPQALADLGITGATGKAVYRRVRPGLIYTFELKADGEIEERVTPDL